MNYRSIVVLPAAVAALAGCGGGTVGSVGKALPPPSAAASATPQATSSGSRGSATILIPARSHATASGLRGTSWVSPSTQSLTITITNQSDKSQRTFASYPVTPTSAGCSATASGTLCVLPFAAPIGVDSVSIYAWDASDSSAYGTQLAAYNGRNVPFYSGTDNSLSFTLGGIIGSFNAMPTSTNFTNGSASNATIDISGNAADADGNMIVGAFDAPLCFVIVSSPANAFSISSPLGGAGTVSNCILPQTDEDGNATGAPQSGGTGVTNTADVPSVTIAYNGAANATATVWVGSLSADTAILAGYGYLPLVQSYALTACTSGSCSAPANVARTSRRR